MSGQLTCEVDGSSGDIVAIRPEGLLDLTGTATLRTLLYKALAEVPHGIVIDLARVRLVDDMCLTLFPAVAKRAATEPGVSLVLCGADPMMRGRMAALGVDRGVTISADFSDAVRIVRSRQAFGARFAESFAARGESVPRARQFAGWACGRWQVPEAVTQRIEVIVTELASNAVRHAGTPYQLVLRRFESFIHVAVLDEDDQLAKLVGPATPFSPGGRGLMIVEGFSSSWGSYATTRGKSTWAIVRYRPVAAA
ncbi:ATP-binding protein [Luedemannella helvata]|uniref:ATP-binding protein n=1 Tax=Luedemannella helvata TaxID=349315 RepID=UPI0031E35A1D